MRKTVDIRSTIKPKKLKLYKTNRSLSEAKAADFQSFTDRYRNAFAGSADIVQREFFIGGLDRLEALLIYEKGSVDKELLFDDVLKPLMRYDSENKIQGMEEAELLRYITKASITAGEVLTTKDFNKSVELVFSGLTILVVKGLKDIIVINLPGKEKRPISESDVEKGLRGTREAFVEDIWVNIRMLRKYVKDPELKVDMFELGTRTKSQVAVMYIKSLADDRIVKEVKQRLKKINVGSVLGSGMIEQMIEDNPWSPFPQIKGTERPDRAAAGMLEGRILIIMDGTPHILSVPALFTEFFQAVEDYLEKPHVGIFNRILRMTAFIMATSITAVYIALVTFHPELVPSDLVVSLASDRRVVPFPPVVEALLMELMIEILREAGIRLPTAVGQTVGVVGGIVLGDAAIRANLVSPAVLIVVTVSAICTFVIPTYSMSLVIRLIRLFLMLLAATFGAYGIAIGWLLVFSHLTKLESFSVPYMSPYAPLRWGDLKDSIIRLPIFMLVKRPVSIPGKDKKRAVNNRRKGKNER